MTFQRTSEKDQLHRLSKADLIGLLRSETEETRRLESEIARLSKDELTGLDGRGMLDSALAANLARAKRYGRDVGVVMFDLDHFKAVNDNHGHLIGDKVLRLVGEIIRAHVRAEDTAVRFGGEEFVLLVDGITSDDLLRLVERIREDIERANLDPVVGVPSVTISAGVTMLTRDEEKPIHALDRADRALYQAKKEGRNCVRVVL